ncbi:16S rRNA (cytosine(1402)-N(4))-methyltransferase RsmH [Patescibacteria group bacterium]|nr:16S rRNA (cytosine(1402)-N(4))-methyltransferase RsmH [Patescibacteria group bacterium]
MHTPVLLKEVIEYLKPEPGDIILDATIDGGGHAEAIMQKIGKTGTLIGIDQDAVILENLKSQISNLKNNVILINGNFRNLDELLKNNNIEKIDGAIFDLGTSMLQLEESGRGFTFQKNEPLLMTYKSDINSTDLIAQDIVNKWSEKDITDILYKYGEERFSRRIAKNIVDIRERKEIKTTFDLSEIIRLSVPSFYRNNQRLNCCTKTFQALRIAVNDELNAIEEGLSKVWKLLSAESRLVVISFHSLEDRIVKNFFKEKSKKEELLILTKKPIIPSQEEIISNSSSRSAKLRAIEKYGKGN